MEELYKGYKELILNDKEMADFYEGICNRDDLQLVENEFLLLRNEGNEIVDKFQYKNNVLERFCARKISNDYTGNIIPRNPQQELAFGLLQNREVTIKVLTGGYGTGKTFLMAAHAISAIKDSQSNINKIVWVRNNVEVKDSMPLGALPGGLYEKLLPFAMPLADHIGGIYGLEALLDQGLIEIVHLGHLRGRDLKNSIIISSEAENLTTQHIQLMIGRVGINSELWLDGDHKQTDKTIFSTNSGLKRVTERLKGNKLFGTVHLEKSERSETAQLADLLD